ncbi:MAG: RNA-guided endonuclease IscB, partial [Thermaerobacter sp.]|nr:RNA-guided endonuclease IscB [Thermaerobacter sp.]
MVFVLDAHHKPLMPCTEKRARLLLQRGRAVVHRPEPFTIRLKDRTQEGSTLQPLRLKLDPGSKVTGVAVLRFVSQDHAAAVFLAQIMHRQGIKKRLDVRRGVRRSRRSRKTRHRPARFDCRARRNGRLPPSLAARVDQTLRVVGKLTKLLPLTQVSVENIRFDTQALQNPEISGVNYQRGTLAGYEVREYLLEKFRHECAYCGGASGDPVLNVDHVVPRSRGGTDQVSNLALVCRTC